ncbi:MAG: hypothetical protein LBK23_01325 [Oscillospiraceae bacterium]|jgi:hypothetical protein|nr:hypothetical protein [Oscillospiraceae bacterium]
MNLETFGVSRTGDPIGRYDIPYYNENPLRLYNFLPSTPFTTPPQQSSEYERLPYERKILRHCNLAKYELEEAIGGLKRVLEHFEQIEIAARGSEAEKPDDNSAVAKPREK